MPVMYGAGFSRRDWDLAPQYKSPIDNPRVVVLKFDRLLEMADEEEANGSFRPSADGTLAKAPLFVDDLPAAFYRLHTDYNQFTPNINTSDRETIVVIEGVLKVVPNDGRERPDPTDLSGTFYTADVLELRREAVSMQAVGLVDPARCLALALYRDRDIQTQRELEVLAFSQTSK
jgi:hypothetical protein